MATNDAFALQQSDLNGFLFAHVGEEASGMPLSVLSALARLGLDPWQEARRLASLPARTAIDGLAQTIATMPASLWPLPDATIIAERLVGLLPVRRGGSVAPAPVRPADRIAPRTLAAGLLLAAAILGAVAIYFGG